MKRNKRWVLPSFQFILLHFVCWTCKTWSETEWWDLGQPDFVPVSLLTMLAYLLSEMEVFLLYSWYYPTSFKANWKRYNANVQYSSKSSFPFFFAALGFSYYFEWIGHSSHMNLVSEIIFQFIFESLSYYIFHRILHSHPKIYSNTHHIHHSRKCVDVYESIRNHTIENILNSCAFIVPALVAKSLLNTSISITGFSTFMYIRECITHNTHLGNSNPPLTLWSFQPWWAAPQDYAYHHSNPNKQVNMGTMKLWDILFQTYEPKITEKSTNYVSFPKQIICTFCILSSLFLFHSN